jgi:hypothetical protein
MICLSCFHYSTDVAVYYKYNFRFWYVNLNKFRPFENRVLRRIFGPRRDEVTGDWRKRHNEELHNLYSSLNIIRMIKSEDEMGRACSTNGGDE